MQSEKPALLDMDLAQLKAFVTEHFGVPQYRAGQIYAWLMRGAGFHEMSNLPADLRQALAQRAVEGIPKIVRTLRSQIDDTRKYLFEFADGQCVEGVRMTYAHGHTLCISTQAGCRMGCTFCASAIGGLSRNLTSGEMLGQIIAVNRASGGGRQVDNVVLMGSGEPLDNYEQVVRFLRRLNEPEGLHIGLRSVTVSTCGLPGQIRRLAEEGLPVTLAVSLHAPNDQIRRRMMPVARAHAMEDVLDAMRYYVRKTGRRATVEYALVKGGNDAPEHAKELAARLRGMQVHVNVIALNAVEERELSPPEEAAVRAFISTLEESHIPATLRRSMGNDIKGACGQLRQAHREEVQS